MLFREISRRFMVIQRAFLGEANKHGISDVLKAAATGGPLYSYLLKMVCIEASSGKKVRYLLHYIV